ncbi:helix-turn-helix domain-containing protein [Streptomyces sp. NPDC002838]|uniref:helix-turn-helix domain-containing protein n=1 Tax=Streptomyces sp. NPDC002838 TaxID=3154436 RepID=UPI00332867C0
MKRLRARLGRLFGRPRRTPGLRGAAPLWVRGLTAGGRPVVLGVALLMCAPGEYHLARNAGWDDPFSYGMPVVLSAYAGIAAAVASTRRAGDRGRWSAIIGACLALGLAMAAQVVSHLIDTGHVIANQPFLIAVTSLVPPAVVGHLLHLAASPPDAKDATASTAVPSVPDSTNVELPEPVEPPTVTLERDTEQDADGTPELPPGTDQDAEDEPRPEPPLMTSNDVARHYGIKPSTVRNWVADGRIPVHSKDASGRNLFHPDQLPAISGSVVPV